MDNTAMATKRLEEIFKKLAEQFKDPELISSSALDDSKPCQQWLPFFGAAPSLKTGASFFGSNVFSYDHPKYYYDLRVHAFENDNGTERWTKVAINWKSFRAEDPGEVAEFATSLRNAANNACDIQKAFDGWHSSFTVEEQAGAYKAFHAKYKAVMEYLYAKRQQTKEQNG